MHTVCMFSFLSCALLGVQCVFFISLLLVICNVTAILTVINKRVHTCFERLWQTGKIVILGTAMTESLTSGTALRK